MEKGKAFIVVGHEHWGKSRTLMDLTGGSKNKSSIIIKKVKFKINRKSNDDEPERVVKFFAKNCPEHTPYIILTLCPNFENPNRWTAPILEFVWYRYELYFGVIKKKYNSDEVIFERDIDKLHDYIKGTNGKLEIFNRQVESNIRARKFQDFIEANL